MGQRARVGTVPQPVPQSRLCCTPRREGTEHISILTTILPGALLKGTFPQSGSGARKGGEKRTEH